MNPSKGFPIVTLLLLVTNIAVFVYQMLDPQNGLWLAAVPCEVWGTLRLHSLWPPFTLVTSAFLHADILHIAFNMLFLWVFGDNVEDRLGHFRFLGFYLTAAVVATLCHVIPSPSSTTPLVGASGAISGVLGAYLFYFPKAKIKTLLILIIIPFRIVLPAWIFLGVWFGTQIYSSLTISPGQGGVAWYAHIGGFLFGFLMSLRRDDKHSTTRK